MTEQKECFFITPIGDQGSEERERSNKVKKHIIEEAMNDYDYSVIRADEIDEPGSITNKVLQKTIDSDLVIADLTDHNANVFYELGVRHAAGEPYIQLIQSGQSPPFDLQDERTVFYGLDVAKASSAREEIRGHIESIEKGERSSDNPVSRAVQLEELVENADPEDNNIIELMENINEKVAGIQSKVEKIEEDRNNNQKNTSNHQIEKEQLDDEAIQTIGEALKKADIKNKNFKSG